MNFGPIMAPLLMLISVAVMMKMTPMVEGFTPAMSWTGRPHSMAISSLSSSSTRLSAHRRKTLVMDPPVETLSSSVDTATPSSKRSKNNSNVKVLLDDDDDAEDNNNDKENWFRANAVASAIAVSTAASAAWMAVNTPSAMAVSKETMDSVLNAANLNPATFQPVCPASDVLYRFLQSSVVSIVGRENFIEYGPLIAGGLLRVRLEICVVESFFQEAVGPFIEKNGLSWILPLHETVETFLAGAIFAFASTFILIGSTKIISVLAAYTDFLLGVPSRLLGGFVFDRASGKAVTLDIGFGPFKTRLVGPPEEENVRELDWSKATFPELIVLVLSGAVRLFGQALGFIRNSLDKVDVFVGRYLVLWATGYVLIKFLHFKVFPDFP